MTPRGFQCPLSRLPLSTHPTHCHRTFSSMGERSFASPTTSLRLLQSTPRRQQDCDANIHVLRPILNRVYYERVLDFEQSSGEPPFDIPHFQKNKPGFSTVSRGDDLSNADGDSWSLLVHREDDAMAPHRTPPLNDPSSGFHGDSDGPQSWRQICFNLNHPNAYPSSTPFPRPSASAPDSMPSLNVENFLKRDDWPGNEHRKSCEYCRFRKKKCSGHDTCIRCSRVGIDCVYMPDLVAKRVANCLLEHSRLLPASRLPLRSASNPGAGRCIDRHSQTGPERSPCLDGNFPEFPAGPPGRGTKRRKRAENGTAKRRKNPAGKDLTQSPRFANQPNLLGDGADHIVAGFGSTRVELTPRAARATDSQNTGHGCVNVDALDRKACATLVPESRDTPQLQELYGDSPTIGQEYTRNDASIPQLTPVQPYGRLPRSEISDLDMAFAGVEVVQVLGFDLFPPLETGSSLEPVMDPSVHPSSFPSISPSSLGSPLQTGVTVDLDSGEVWTVDDWLTWYDFHSS